MKLPSSFAAISILYSLVLAPGIAQSNIGGIDDVGGDGTGQTNHAISVDPYVKLKKPKSVLEIIKNIKYVTDNNLLTTEELYTEEHLKLVLGGDRVKSRTIAGRGISGEVLGFDSMVQSVKVNNNWKIDGLSIFFRRAYLSSGRTEGLLALNVRGDSNVTLSDIERFFGKNHKQSRNIMSPHGGPIPSAYIEYSSVEENTERLMEFRFGQGFILITANFSEVKK